jgi:hypothetical protein
MYACSLLLALLQSLFAHQQMQNALLNGCGSVRVASGARASSCRAAGARSVTMCKVRVTPARGDGWELSKP